MLANLSKITFVEKAKAAVKSARLLFKDNWILVVCHGRKPRRLCPYDGDESWTLDSGIKSQSPRRLPESSALDPRFPGVGRRTRTFVPVWASVVECQVDNTGKFVSIIAAESGNIGTDLNCAFEHRLIKWNHQLS